MKKKTSVIKNHLYFLGLIWKISPFRIISSFLVEVAGFGNWVFFSVIFTEYLFGGEKLRSFSEVLVFIWVSVAIFVLTNVIFVTFYNYYIPKSNLKLHYKLNGMLFNKAKTVDISCYETPEFYNSYTKAAAEANDKAQPIIQQCATAVSALFAATFVTVKMVRITPWALVFIVLPLMGNLYFGKKQGKVNFDINEQTTPARRRLDYVNRIVYFRKYAGELRLTNIYAVLEKMFKASADSEAEITVRHAFKRSLYGIIKAVLIFVLGYEGMWLCATILALAGDISIGDLVVLLNAIVSVSWMMTDLENSIQGITTNAFFIDNLKNFLGFEPAINESLGGKIPPKDVETIEFKNVSFGYKGQDGLALRNVSLTMRRGVRHALVGINGSGKSTLIKLMMRFYDPTEGEILLNGVNIKEFDIKKYRALIGAAFQDFALFAATVTENVLLFEPKTDMDRDLAVTALKNSDAYAKIETLPLKEDALLTREFDNEGVELSGGERQKIAIARAFAKQSPIIILDEPSSALDPIAEYKMFETVTKLCKGENKLSVIVSHRLSSAAMCEKLFVFEKGSLVEQGSHSELLQNNGLYADMFNKQARNYSAVEVIS